jgi:peptidoglycan-associated lipoprotein
MHLLENQSKFMNKRILSLVTLSLTLLVFTSACKKKVPPLQTPPTPVQPKPVERTPPPTVVSFSADPSTVLPGEATNLKWSVLNATDLSIDHGVGTVSDTGTRRVVPSGTTTYNLTASGPGGGPVTASVQVVVSTPPPPPPPAPAPAAPKKSLSERLGTDVQDIYFDYDKSEIREDARAALQRDVEALKAIFRDYPTAVVSLEGHCDERGSAEYNLGLGDRRSTTAKDFLTQAGVPGDRLRTISYGKEKPQCTEADESCWQRNRRVHFSAQ